MVFHWSLNDSNSPQISRTLLSILADLNNAVDWMVSTRSLISKFSSPFNNPSVTVPRAPITIVIMVTFMFHNFFISIARSMYLAFVSLYFNLIMWSAWTAKSKIQQVLFFLLLSFIALVVWLRFREPFVSRNPRGVYASHFPG